MMRLQTTALTVKIFRLLPLSFLRVIVRFYLQKWSDERGRVWDFIGLQLRLGKRTSTRLGVCYWGRQVQFRLGHGRSTHFNLLPNRLQWWHLKLLLRLDSGNLAKLLGSLIAFDIEIDQWTSLDYYLWILSGFTYKNDARKKVESGGLSRNPHTIKESPATVPDWQGNFSSA